MFFKNSHTLWKPLLTIVKLTLTCMCLGFMHFIASTMALVNIRKLSGTYVPDESGEITCYILNI